LQLNVFGSAGRPLIFAYGLGGRAELGLVFDPSTVAVYDFEGWKGYSDRVDGFIDTNSWIGWLKRPNRQEDWFYAYSLSNWMYLSGC